MRFAVLIAVVLCWFTPAKPLGLNARLKWEVPCPWNNFFFLYLLFWLFQLCRMSHSRHGLSAEEGLILPERTCPWHVCSPLVAKSLHKYFWCIPVGLYATEHWYSKCSSKRLQKCPYLFFGMSFLCWGLGIRTFFCDASLFFPLPRS